MKILFLQDDFPPHAKDGAGIVAAVLARELVKRGHDLTIVTSVQERGLAGSFYEEGMRIERIYSDYAPRWRSWLSLYNPATAAHVKQILAEVKPDVVHAHNVHFFLSYWSLRLAKKNGAKVFLTTHDVMLFHYGKLVENLPKDCVSPRNYRVGAWQQFRRYRFWYNPLRNVVIRQLLKNVDNIFAVSSALKDALVQNGIKNVEVIYNGIDAAGWEVSPEVVQSFAREHNLENKKAILFGGRISTLKGGDVMFEAMRNIVKKEPSAVLLLLGRRDAYVEKLLKRAEKAGLAEHVLPVGWISGDSLKAAYHAASMVVVPSQYLDPLPTVALEAMACGKPVVGTCMGGIPEMVEDGISGYVVNSQNINQLSSQILGILGDIQKLKTMGKAGKERLQQFSVEKQIEKLLKIYEEIL